MKTGRILGSLALLVAASIAAAACQSTGQTTAPVTTSNQEQTTTAAPVQTTAASGKPVYGGSVTMVLSADIGTFDEGAGFMHSSAYTLHLTNEELVTGDWTRGAAGTGEFDWGERAIGGWDTKAPSLAESWDTPEPGHIIFHLRHGVKYAVFNSDASRLVNGRELTSNDVKFTLDRAAASPLSGPHYGDWPKATTTAPDKYTIDIKIDPSLSEEIAVTTDFCTIMPPEVMAKYKDMTDWRNSVGTGPFILKDYVQSSSATLTRNPNYWRTDPVGPGKGNQLPYLDTASILVIPDVSTRLAALRTKSVDMLQSINWEDARELNKNAPELLSLKWYTDIGLAVSMRTDKANLPYKDIKVRQALMYATDFQTIKNTFDGGEAQIDSWPLVYTKEYKDAYYPFDKLPANVQDLYKYNPDKAKQMLADAGYPNGFKCTAIVNNTASNIDYASIIKAEWAKVGVDMTLQPKENAVYNSIALSRVYDDMIFSGPGPDGDVFLAFAFAGGMAMGNMSWINDPKVEAARTIMRTYSIYDPPKAAKANYDLMPYVHEQAWAIPAPTPPQFNMWWPWVKNYHGETSIGRDNTFNFAMFTWVDQGLKASMTGK